MMKDIDLPFTPHSIDTGDSQLWEEVQQVNLWLW